MKRQGPSCSGSGLLLATDSPRNPSVPITTSEKERVCWYRHPKTQRPRNVMLPPVEQPCRLHEGHTEPNDGATSRPRGQRNNALPRRDQPISNHGAALSNLHQHRRYREPRSPLSAVVSLATLDDRHRGPNRCLQDSFLQTSGIDQLMCTTRDGTNRHRETAPPKS